MIVLCFILEYITIGYVRISWFFLFQIYNKVIVSRFSRILFAFAYSVLSYIFEHLFYVLYNVLIEKYFKMILLGMFLFS